MKKLLGLFLIGCISAVLGLGSTGCTKKETKAPDKPGKITTPKDGDKDKDKDKDMDKDKDKDKVTPPPSDKDKDKDKVTPPPSDKDKDKTKDKDKGKNEDKDKGAALSRDITVASLSPAALDRRFSRYLAQ